MNVLQSLVLGLIQGLTEYIPVSSTAHLLLAPELLPIAAPRPEIRHVFDTFIQLGTVFPVLIYFWRDWLKLIQAAGRILRRRSISNDLDERMVQYLIVGSLPAGVIGLLVKKHVEALSDTSHNRIGFLVIGLALVLGGIVLWWTEKTGQKRRTVEQIRMPDAWFVGFAQAFALIPGISRSGATMTAGLFTGLTREAAARFSFLLMTPIMIAATGLDLVHLLKEHGKYTLTTGEWQGMFLATAVAAVTGYAAIAFFLNWLRSRSLGFFALWRLLAGGFAIGLFFMQGR